MISDSTTLLAVVLERRFGVRWLQRWQKLPDEETRWLALYLADEVSRGRNFGRGEAATSAIMAARAQLPPAKRTDRTAFSLLGTFQTAGL